MNTPRAQLNRLLHPQHQDVPSAMPGARPCPCCGRPSARFYRVRPGADRAWGMACVLCAVRVLENSADAVLGGSASATAVAASAARKRRRRERRAA